MRSQNGAIIGNEEIEKPIRSGVDWRMCVHMLALMDKSKREGPQQ
jgi:hypothetical protein